MSPQNVPLSLYIHIPWCVRKCPYCDFNSHEQRADLPESAYVQALLEDLSRDADMAQGREIQSIFFGGGTPSLFSGRAIADILAGVAHKLSVAKHAEITLEANPGTAEQKRFTDYAAAGINRISLGVQSFDDQALKRLGRIHGASEAKGAVDMLGKAGITNFNIDLMHGLPEQTTAQALSDLNLAYELGAPHISWYQLTVEPNTVFYNRPPVLPVEDTLADIQERGAQLLNRKGFQQYEVSAWATSPEHRSKHNLNYWQFADYLALGAGAHGKISSGEGIKRYWKTRKPEDYLSAANYTAGERMLVPDELPLEFMMNALRLNEGFTEQLFELRTGLGFKNAHSRLNSLQAEGFMEFQQNRWRPTELGQRYLDDLLQRF